MGVRALLGADRERDLMGRRIGDLERLRIGDLRGGDRPRRTGSGDRRRETGDRCLTPTGLPLPLLGDLIGERRLLRCGEGDLLRGEFAAGCRASGTRRRGDIPRLRSGDGDFLRAEGDTDFFRGESRRLATPSLSASL